MLRESCSSSGSRQIGLGKHQAQEEWGTGSFKATPRQSPRSHSLEIKPGGAARPERAARKLFS